MLIYQRSSIFIQVFNFYENNKNSPSAFLSDNNVEIS